MTGARTWCSAPSLLVERSRLQQRPAFAQSDLSVSFGSFNPPSSDPLGSTRTRTSSQLVPFSENPWSNPSSSNSNNNERSGKSGYFVVFGIFPVEVADQIGPRPDLKCPQATKSFSRKEIQSQPQPNCNRSRRQHPTPFQHKSTRVFLIHAAFRRTFYYPFQSVQDPLGLKRTGPQIHHRNSFTPSPSQTTPITLPAVHF